MTIRKILTAAAALLVLFATTATAQMPQTTTDKMPGDATVTKEELKGEVVYVQGTDLVVRMASGEIRIFRVPETRKFIIDGRELSVHQLQKGTSLTATVTTTTTPVTVRTTTVGSGKVWFVSGNALILTLPNGENRQYAVDSDVNFIVNGGPATVRDLKPGMTITAQKIVEEPRTEIASDTRVVGHAPATAEATRVASAAPAASEPSQLPKTASPIPLLGLMGLLSLGASAGLRLLRLS